MILIGPDRDLLITVTNTDETVMGLHLTGWLCAVRGQVMHALDAAQVAGRLNTKSRRKTYDAACGALVRLYPYPTPEHDLIERCSALWPPRVATLTEGASRCRDCWESTGRRRPSAYFPEVTEVPCGG